MGCVINIEDVSTSRTTGEDHSQSPPLRASPTRTVHGVAIDGNTLILHFQTQRSRFNDIVVIVTKHPEDLSRYQHVLVFIAPLAFVLGCTSSPNVR